MAVSRVNYVNKRSGDLWTSNNANEVKEAINNNATELAAAQTAIAALQDQSYASVVNQTETTVAISANVLNVWNTAVASLSVTLIVGTGGRPDEYMMQFTVSGSSFNLSLPSNIRWSEEPEWQDGWTYQVSIQNGLALYAGWEAAAS